MSNQESATQKALVIQGCSEIGCIPLTSGPPAVDDIPAKDQLPIRLDAVNRTVYFYDCCTETWFGFEFAIDTNYSVNNFIITPNVNTDGVETPGVSTISLDVVDVINGNSLLDRLSLQIDTPNFISADPDLLSIEPDGNGNIVFDITLPSVCAQMPELVADNVIQLCYPNVTPVPVDEDPTLCELMPDLSNVIQVCY